MRILLLVIGIFIFSGCASRYNTNCETGCFSSDRQGKVYKTGEYYIDCGCQKTGFFQYFQRNNCNCNNTYRYMGPTTSCGADGMCIDDEF